MCDLCVKRVVYLWLKGILAVKKKFKNIKKSCLEMIEHDCLCIDGQHTIRITHRSQKHYNGQKIEFYKLILI